MPSLLDNYERYFTKREMEELLCIAQSWKYGGMHPYVIDWLRTQYSEGKWRIEETLGIDELI